MVVPESVEVEGVKSYGPVAPFDPVHATPVVAVANREFVLAYTRKGARLVVAKSRKTVVGAVLNSDPTPVVAKTSGKKS